LKVYVFRAKRRGITRLVVGGLHGREGRVTRPILKEFILEGGPRRGCMVVVPSLCLKKRYISTLKSRYFEVEEGKKLLRLISRFKPDVYVEVHCYAKKAYKSLTSPSRLVKRGVPPFIELENGLLIGSVSPHLLAKRMFKLGLAIEIPCRGDGAKSELLKLLRVIRDEDTVNGVLATLRSLYPKQIELASKLFAEYVERLRAEQS